MHKYTLTYRERDWEQTTPTVRCHLFSVHVQAASVSCTDSGQLTLLTDSNNASDYTYSRENIAIHTFGCANKLFTFINQHFDGFARSFQFFLVCMQLFPKVWAVSETVTEFKWVQTHCAKNWCWTTTYASRKVKYTYYSALIFTICTKEEIRVRMRTSSYRELTRKIVHNRKTVHARNRNPRTRH